MTYSLERVGIGNNGDDRDGEAVGARKRRARSPGYDLNSRDQDGLRGTVEAEVVPLLLKAHFPSDAKAYSEALSLPLLRNDDIANLAELLVGQDLSAAASLVEGRHREGVPLDSLYLDLLSPAAKYLGTLWEQDLCDFGDVTVGLCHLRQLLRDLSPTFLNGTEQSDPNRRALLMTAPGEQHSLGLFMVAEFFRRAGWDVVTAGPASRQDMASLVRRDWYGVIGLSAACDTRVETVEDCVRTIRQVSKNRTVAVMVGGPLFLIHPEYGTQVGADASATDGRQATMVAQKLLANIPSRI